MPFLIIAKLLLCDVNFTDYEYEKSIIINCDVSFSC